MTDASPTRWPWVRVLAATRPITPVEVAGPLRVLVATASPEYAGEPQRSRLSAAERQLTAALAEPTEAGLIEVCWLREASSDELATRLRDGPWHVLHHLGRIADLAGAVAMPPLVVLESADGTTPASFAGLAAALTGRGVGAVVALRFEPAEAPPDVLGTFYGALALGHGVVEAVEWARAAAFGRPEASLPKLYLSCPDPRLFRFRAGSRGTPVEASAPEPSGAEPPEEPPIPPTSGEVTEARRVRAELWHGGSVRRTFVAGATNAIRCWIGLPASDDAATADRVIPAIALPPQGIDLSVELRWAGEPASDTIHLPADRTASSTACDLHLDVPEGATEVVAELMFRYRGRCFEAVAVQASALPVGQPESPEDSALSLRTRLEHRRVIALPDAEPCTATLVFGAGGTRLGTYLGGGGRTYELPTPARARDALSAQLFAAQQSLVRRSADVRDGRQVLNTGDEDVRVLIRDLARFGAGLFTQLRQQGLSDPGSRLQVLTLDPESLVPLEFVYDRGNPDSGARLCAGWAELADLPADASECPACGPPPDEPPLHTAVVCPLGFWSLSRVIERLDPTIAEGGSMPLPGRRSLPAIASVVFACTNQVPEEDQAAAWEAIRAHVPDAVLAHDWDEWSRDLGARPTLLVALAHHGEGDFEDYLEIGAAGLPPDVAHLRRSQLGPAYVNPDGHDPGPILLLLGCRTGVESDLGYVELVREFERYRASIVLGTQDRILGRHAGPLAAELVSELTSVTEPADFGSVLRRVRRRMLGRGLLLGFGLVALGDAAWRLSPTTPDIPATESRPT